MRDHGPEPDIPASKAQPPYRLAYLAVCLAALGALLAGCSILDNYPRENGGCSDLSGEIAAKMAARHATLFSPHCSYGTRWLVMADSGRSEFERVLGELKSEGWQEDTTGIRRPDEGVLRYPSFDDAVSDTGIAPYVVFDSSDYRIELMADLEPE